MEEEQKSSPAQIKEKRNPEMENLFIPEYLLKESTQGSCERSDVPSAPILIFINAKSGGKTGGVLIDRFRLATSRHQVFDLVHNPPDVVLRRVLSRMERLAKNGDKFAMAVRSRLRILVAGGDGSAGWILATVADLKLENPPPVATAPLGTGNNLPYSFGWGRHFHMTDTLYVEKFLLDVAKANPMHVDGWKVLMRVASSKSGHSEVRLPNSLHSFKKAPPGDESDDELTHIYQGGFWNYFSLGMDAEVAYGFHSLRERRPWLFFNQFINQMLYSHFACAQGWFCTSCVHPNPMGIESIARLRYMKKGDGEWHDLMINPRDNIRCIVLLNLPSYAGGLNPWGRPTASQAKKMGFTDAFVDDGLLEVVGFRDAWHGCALLASNGHGCRLAQATRVLIELSGDNDHLDHTFMRMDGEPWRQPLPMEGRAVRIEIQAGSTKSLILAKDGSIAQTASLSPNVTIDPNMVLRPLPLETFSKPGLEESVGPVDEEAAAAAAPVAADEKANNGLANGTMRVVMRIGGYFDKDNESAARSKSPVRVKIGLMKESPAREPSAVVKAQEDGSAAGENKVASRSEEEGKEAVGAIVKMSDGDVAQEPNNRDVQRRRSVGRTTSSKVFVAGKVGDSSFETPSSPERPRLGQPWTSQDPQHDHTVLKER